MSAYLTPEELVELTRKSRYTAQRKALDRMGIAYRTRDDGSAAVLWSDARPAHDQRPAARREPRLRLDA